MHYHVSRCDFHVRLLCRCWVAHGASTKTEQAQRQQAANANLGLAPRLPKQKPKQRVAGTAPEPAPVHRPARPAPANHSVAVHCLKVNSWRPANLVLLQSHQTNPPQATEAGATWVLLLVQRLFFPSFSSFLLFCLDREISPSSFLFPSL